MGSWSSVGKENNDIIIPRSDAAGAEWRDKAEKVRVHNCSRIVGDILVIDTLNR